MSDDRKAPSGERAERKRAAIVRAARDVFLREGFGAGMDLIATEAGVSKVTVYNHYDDKEDLFQAVIGDALQAALGRSLDCAEECLRGDQDIRDSLLETARMWVQGMTQPDVLKLRTLVTSELRRFPDLGRAWQANGPDRFRPVIATALERRIDQGVLRIPDVDLAITQFYSLVLYPHFVHTTYGEHIPDDTAEQLITGGIDMFLTYYRA